MTHFYIAALRKNLTTLSNNFEDSILRFHVETDTSSFHWPFNKLVTYKTKVVDTHNAIDIGTGIFTAPLTGVYGFFFYSEFYCDDSKYFSLYLYHNNSKIEIYKSHGESFNTKFITSKSVYFAREMEVNDTLKIFSGTADFNFSLSPTKFMGFLLKKK